ncbi:MAG: hypothetical protein C0467_17145 [Planctomycetaceae bacterium]|nr:hypothetical protein [Planctomycetaceae bacterium]
MSRRSGLTLTEVLVTLAILSFGILAILTLFPLAASQMAVAVREDRSAQAANAADGYMRAYWKSEVADKIRTGVPVTEPFFTAMDDPNAGVPLADLRLTLLLAGLTESSFPVFVDPIGVAARTGPGKNWMGDGGNANAPRRSLSLLGTNPTQAFRACSLMDGLGYDDNGHPTPDREMRYNWMWMLQRQPGASKDTADMTVIVYDNRPNLYAPTGVEAGFQSLGVMLPGSSSLKLTFTGPAPNVKPGTWIVDVTDPILSLPATKTRNANFYQVVTAGEPSGGSIDLELNNPLKKSNDPLVGAYVGKFLVLKGVSGVYPRAPLTGE